MGQNGYFRAKLSVKIKQNVRASSILRIGRQKVFYIVQFAQSVFPLFGGHFGVLFIMQNSIAWDVYIRAALCRVSVVRLFFAFIVNC